MRDMPAPKWHDAALPGLSGHGTSNYRDHDFNSRAIARCWPAGAATIR